MNRLWLVVFFFISSLEQVHAMQALLVRQKFIGHELTAGAIIDYSNQIKDSVIFGNQKDIIAIFNYKEQTVMVCLDTENTCELSYLVFKDLMLECWKPHDMKEHIKTEDNKSMFDIVLGYIGYFF